MLTVTGVRRIYDVLLILLSLIEIQFNPLFHLSSSLGLVGENTERERKSARWWVGHHPLLPHAPHEGIVPFSRSSSSRRHEVSLNGAL